MRLREVHLLNFRRHRGPITIPIDEITAFVGANDAGKSSVLEALNIFFSSERGAIENDDLSKQAESATISIGCSFDKFPSSLIIDAEVRTSLKDELLLNKKGFLEIHRIWDFGSGRPKEKVIARCMHPVDDKVADLLTLKIADLKKRANELGIISKTYDARISSSIRKSIRDHVGVVEQKETDLPLSEGELKNIWDQLRHWLPSYALFKADRPSTDADDEFQDPMKIAIQSALNEIRHSLEDVEQQVKAKTLEVAKRTLEKLNEMNPDLAKELNPQFDEPKWSGVFKLGLIADDQIPLNKRGSGTRRLILLNFFRAEAERRAIERAKQQQYRATTIYAIEEPETSQHPEHQIILVRALKEIADSPYQQVLLTTHVPALAGMLPKQCLRHVVKVGKNSNVLWGEDILAEVANNLGVLPDPIQPNQVVVLVEGPTDVKFLESVSATLHSVDPKFPSLATNSRIVIAPLGGATLRDWVRNHYLRNLGLPELHLYDRGDVAKSTYKDEAEAVNRRGDGSKAIILKRREIENYVHPEAIFRTRGIRVTVTADNDVPVEAARLIHIRAPDSGDWEQLTAEEIARKAASAKRWLTDVAATQMTYEEICQADSDNEIRGFLLEISDRLAVTAAALAARD